jgi:hypothetical protein
MQSGDKFRFDQEEYRIISYDARKNRSNVAIDRGCDSNGNERRIEAERIGGSFTRRFSEAEIGETATVEGPQPLTIP